MLYVVILQTDTDVAPIYVGKSLEKAIKIEEETQKRYDVNSDNKKPFGLVYLKTYSTSRPQKYEKGRGR